MTHGVIILHKTNILINFCNKIFFLFLYFSFLVCHRLFTESTGIIKSPGYPNIYPNDRKCTYLISLPIGKAIYFSFIDFDIEKTNYPACTYDNIKVYIHFIFNLTNKCVLNFTQLFRYNITNKLLMDSTGLQLYRVHR